MTDQAPLYRPENAAVVSVGVPPSDEPNIKYEAESQLLATQVRQRALGAVRWSATSRIIVLTCQFGGTVLLAHLLTPSEFGIAAIVLVVSNFALLISDLGLGAAIIHERDPRQSFLDTAFWINALLGIVMTLIVVAAALPIAALYGKPQLFPLLLLSSLTYSLSLTVVPLALMERSLSLRPAAISEIAAAITSLIAGVIIAGNGGGAYALVAMPIVNVGILTICYSFAVKYVPRSFARKADAHRIWRYSRGLTGFNIINYFTRNSDDLLIGRFASSASLGFYNRAFLIMLLPVQQVQLVIGRVLFPALRTVSDDPVALRAAHRQALYASSALCAPIAVLVAGCSHDFVIGVFGRAWTPMIPMVAILASTGVQQVFQGTAGTLYQVTGRTALMFTWNVAFTIITVASFAVGVHWGAIGVCVAVAVRGWTLWPITVAVPYRLIGETFTSVLPGLLRLSGCLVVEAGACLAVWALTAPLIGSPLVRLLLELVVGSGAYLVMLWTTDRAVARALLGMIRSR